jgi:protein-disulfide isomerase
LIDLDLGHLALGLGIEIYRFQQSLESDPIQRRVASDYESGVRSNVTGTPTFFINGHRYRGKIAVEPMLKAIESFLAPS